MNKYSVKYKHDNIYYVGYIEASNYTLEKTTQVVFRNNENVIVGIYHRVEHIMKLN